ncbi:MAG TPA: ribonuclease H-like domain-containing protein [Terriglobia bacterium]|nr:ribonuclease H-like domain-containing protein [Terriglobia bacterium]
MNLEQKLAQLKKGTQKNDGETELERQLELLQRVGAKVKGSGIVQLGAPLPAQRMPKGIEVYVDGGIEQNTRGEYFLARQALPFGRPYGKLRIGDLTTTDLQTLNMFLAGATLPEISRLIFLDTETTGLAGGTGTCAFLIGLGAVEGTQFVVRQFFLRDYPEEAAILAALAETLKPFDGIVTFNGKTFDLPLLETRYALARMKSPFARLLHLDLLHPARRLWKLRLASCKLGHLESEVLGVHREGDVDGSEIPGIYFDYLRTGNARGLQPVFYHNALDIISLAGLTVEMAEVIAAQVSAPEESRSRQSASVTSSIDLFSLSRIFERSGAQELSLSTCRRALDAGLPQPIETQALWQLASQHKRRSEYERSVEIWTEITLREEPFALRALEELAIHYEHRLRDAETALDFTLLALGRLNSGPGGGQHGKFSHRMKRLRKKIGDRKPGLGIGRNRGGELTRGVDPMDQKSFV